MNYKEALEYLDELNVFGISLGLVRIQKLLELMGNPQNDYKTIHVTGTNGKGSVTAMLTEILKQSGAKVGMYTSPHLVSYTERMQINGEWISQEKFATALTVVRDLCEFMVGEGDEHPTQFEVLTAAAFYYFKQAEVDYAVIEVGLGGLLDSTNVITPSVSVITNVSFEHADKCGGTLQGIAEHKAGIIKEQVPVVTGASGEALDIIRKRARELDAPLIVMGQEFSVKPVQPLGQLSIPPNLGSTGYGTPNPALVDLQIEALSNLPWDRCENEAAVKKSQLVEFAGFIPEMPDMDYKLGLLGLHQVYNSGLAAATAMLLAVEDLRITRRAIKRAMLEVLWPGRFELIKGYDYKLLIDGAHNPAGIDTLRKSLEYYFPEERRIFVLGILKDKDFAGMLKQLLRQEDIVIFTTPSSERAADPVDLLEFANVVQKEAIGDPSAALERGKQLALEYMDGDKKTMLICAGSLYLIGALRELLVRK